LTWEDVLRVGGPEVDLHARIARKGYDRLVSTDVPDRLRVGTYEIVQTTPERTQIVSYSKLDPLDLPTVLIQLLPFFDGRPKEEVLEQLRNEAKLNLSEGLVRKLVDYNVLVPA
jgi:hypothetical protein